jgi:TatD DNase family protein
MVAVRRWTGVAAAAGIDVSYVDTHCHIGHYDDPLAVLRRAEDSDVVTIAVTESPAEFQRLTLQLGKRKFLRVALGIHPLRAGSATPLDLALFGRLLGRVDYVGEVGLDRSREGKATFRQQTKVFEHLLGQPQIGDKVLTVHSRGAEKETIDYLAAAGVTAILHWYSGALGHLDDALAAGLWFSVNAAMLRSKNGQRIVHSLPPERVLTETDGPFTRMARRPSEPGDIPEVVKGLAGVWGEDVAGTSGRIFENMKAVADAARQCR